MSRNVINSYAAYSKNKEIRLESSSGAVFSLLAEKILSQQGVVYGVAMTVDCKSAEFVRIDLRDKLYCLRGSKYMQAKLGDTFIKVRKDLNDGIKVLFSGTGCQINGLKYYLGKDFENLFCVDVICHGVPSPELWKRYVENLESNNNATLININFRCKDKSWNDFGMKETSSNFKQIYTSKDTNPYMQMFLRDYCLRPSCYKCVAKTKKMSDMTIADFWGIDKVAPEMNDGKGTSLVLTRTEKGEEMIGFLKNNLYIKRVNYEDGIRCNPAEYCSVKKPAERDIFFRDMYAMPFDELAKRYAAPKKKTIKSIARKCVKKILTLLEK